MKVLCVDNDSITELKDIEAVASKGCYYPKGSVVQFANEDFLIDFIELLPDNVWDYWKDSVTAIQFIQAYYLEVK